MRARLIDWLFIFAIFAIYAASPPPDVNEAHYLTKARHFWDPDWLRGDLFLESGFAHWLFYVTFGWLTVVFDLPTAAWIGRIVGWAMLAWGWESLASAAGLGRFGKIFASFLLLALIPSANLSGEWLVGGIEAKVPAYALVFFALGNVVRGQWVWVWPVLGLATGFHPLVGGWSFLACLLVRVTTGRGFRAIGAEFGSLAISVLIAVLLGALPMMSEASFGVWPGKFEALTGVWTPSGTSISTEDFEAAFLSISRIQAAEIYVRERVNHHLYFWDFARRGIVSFGLLVLLWREFGRAGPWAKLSPINVFAGASLILVGGGIALSTLSNLAWSRDWANFFLRFYWFRLADVVVPCAVALGVALKLTANREAGSSNIFRIRVIRRAAIALALFASTGICASFVVDRWADGRPGADQQSLPTYAKSSVRTWETYRNWVRVCQWIKDNTPREAEFLTPRQQQTFKWYAARIEYVNWKDIPQDPLGIVEWRTRMDEAFGLSWNEFQLPYIARESWRLWFSNAKTRPRYVVMEQEAWRQLETTGDTSPLELVYPSDPARRTTYVVLRVKPDAYAKIPSPRREGLGRGASFQ